VPCSRGSNRHTWTALIPIVVPVHPIAVGRSTFWTVEVSVPGPAFHVKVVPGATGPSTDIDFTSLFHSGHRRKSATTSHTSSGGAATQISLDATAGALWLICISSDRTVGAVADDRPELLLVEFPADDAERARRFWTGLLGAELEARPDGQGEGWQTRAGDPPVGVHSRGSGPGDSFSLPYFAVDDLAGALERVESLGGSVVHPGERWAICKDSEGSPFGLVLVGAEPA
jgi:predicted enzyme related to lactoylglutathione lyase